MKRNLLACSIVILCGLCGVVSCDKPKVSVEPQTMTLRAAIEQPVAYSASPAMFGDSVCGVQQRTIIQDGTIPHQIVWQANDQIIIHFNTGVQGSMRIFDLTSGAGTGSAEFEYTGFGYTSDPDVTMQEELPEEYDSILAGYPAMFVTVTLENTITVLEAPREIYMGLENVVDYPMYGEADKDGDISFVCPFGMICFPVAGDVTINKIAIDTSYSNDEIDNDWLCDFVNGYQPLAAQENWRIILFPLYQFPSNITFPSLSNDLPYPHLKSLHQYPSYSIIPLSL